MAPTRRKKFERFDLEMELDTVVCFITLIPPAYNTPLLPRPVAHPPIFIMLRRSIFRQQRALAQSLSRTAQSQRSSLSTFSPVPLRTSPVIPQRLERRWQSTEAEKKPDEASKTTEDAAKTEEDPTKKELEAKSKEVVDLKVRQSVYMTCR